MKQMKTVLPICRSCLILAITFTSATSFAFGAPVFQESAQRATPDPYFSSDRANQIKQTQSTKQATLAGHSNDFAKPITTATVARKQNFQQVSTTSAPDSPSNTTRIGTTDASTSGWNPPRTNITPTKYPLGEKQSLQPGISTGGIRLAPVPNSSSIIRESVGGTASRYPLKPLVNQLTPETPASRQVKGTKSDFIPNPSQPKSNLKNSGFNSSNRVASPTRSPANNDFGASNDSTNSFAPPQSAASHSKSDEGEVFFVGQNNGNEKPESRTVSPRENSSSLSNQRSTFQPKGSLLETIEPATEVTETVTVVPLRQFEPTQLLATVGSEPIFVGDLMFEANQRIEKAMPTAPKATKDKIRNDLIKQMLPQFVNTKLMYVGMLRVLPEEASEETLLEQAYKQFDESALPEMLKSSGAKSNSDFDAQLRAQGTSLRKLRLSWSQDQLTRYFTQQQLNVDTSVSHQEMLDAYYENIDSYEIPARSKWEQIMIRFDRCSSRADAEQQIKELGNQIVYGAKLSATAKKSSHGYRASHGGAHDFTSKGALVLKQLDIAIFTLPIGELSDVIETKDGFHILRVVERNETTRTPFLEAQIKIKEKIVGKRREDAFQKHIQTLRSDIPVEYFEVQESDLATNKRPMTKRPMTADLIR